MTRWKAPRDRSHVNRHVHRVSALPVHVQFLRFFKVVIWYEFLVCMSGREQSEPDKRACHHSLQILVQLRVRVISRLKLPTFLGVVLDIPTFTGTRKISELPAFPIQYYAGPGGVDGLKSRLIARGKKWETIAGGVHHLFYHGIASRWHLKSYVKHSVSAAVSLSYRPGFTVFH